VVYDAYTPVTGCTTWQTVDSLKNYLSGWRIKISFEKLLLTQSFATFPLGMVYFRLDLLMQYRPVSIHRKFRRTVSAPKCQVSPKAPGADAAHCGAISVTGGTKQLQWKPKQPTMTRFDRQVKWEIQRNAFVIICVLLVIVATFLACCHH